MNQNHQRAFMTSFICSSRRQEALILLSWRHNNLSLLTSAATGVKGSGKCAGRPHIMRNVRLRPEYRGPNLLPGVKVRARLRINKKNKRNQFVTEVFHFEHLAGRFFPHMPWSLFCSTQLSRAGKSNFVANRTKTKLWVRAELRVFPDLRGVSRFSHARPTRKARHPAIYRQIPVCRKKSFFAMRRNRSFALPFFPEGLADVKTFFAKRTQAFAMHSRPICCERRVCQFGPPRVCMHRLGAANGQESCCLSAPALLKCFSCGGKVVTQFVVNNIRQTSGCGFRDGSRELPLPVI